ncbi:MAG: hypothetical protein IPO15_18780 [Anaerolineae bacterium]|uniref:Hint domain-containing protein n=1 Tax=Candidatus Amarolinea dominans TaxID=3140696 RepID=UPI003134A771|nr:hypothetical protein [Anaerolineae bacterium]
MARVWTPAGRICAERVGPFIDWLWETGGIRRLSRDLFRRDVGRCASPIKAVLRHDHDGPLFEIKTTYGRSVTAAQRLLGRCGWQAGSKRGDEVRPGDPAAPDDCRSASRRRRSLTFQALPALDEALDTDLVGAVLARGVQGHGAR